MYLITMYRASKLPGAPNRSTLSLYSRRTKNRPKYFRRDKGTWKIDIENAEWAELIRAKETIKLNARDGAEIAKSDRVTSATPENSVVKKKSELEMELLIQKVRCQEKEGTKKDEEILKLATENKKEAHSIIDFALAEYLFLGFLDRATREKLNLAKKIEHKIEMEIQGARKIKRPPKSTAKNIVKLITAEEERIIRETKKAQVKDMKNWREEEQG